MTLTIDSSAARPTDPGHDDARDALAGRLAGATLGAFDLLATHLGLKLGLYAALADGASRTVADVAATSGVHPRYAREWLEHQAVGGMVEVDDQALSPEERRYRLPSGHAEALLDPVSLAAVSMLPAFVIAGATALPQLVAAYRTGAGVAWDAYSEELLAGQAAVNRPAFEHLLASEWLGALPDVQARLQQPGARVADLACGAGWSTIAMARAYPNAAVEGLDIDPWSIERAQANARDAGMADLVSFVLADGADPALEGRYDLVTIFEAVHDLARPVEVLRAVRGMLAPGGAVLVVDERVAEHFTAPGDDTERLMYGYSLLFCLANGLAEQPSAATGTVMRPATLERYVRDAGFGGFTILPVHHDAFRLYRLDP